MERTYKVTLRRVQILAPRTLFRLLKHLIHVVGVLFLFTILHTVYYTVLCYYCGQKVKFTLEQAMKAQRGVEV